MRASNATAACLITVLQFVPLVASAQQRPGLVGVFTRSETNKVGSEVVFANLNSASPIVIWPSGNRALTSKVFDDPEFTILFFVASATGGTETFYLNKKSKQFSVIEATLLAGQADAFVQPKVSHGRLK